MRRAPSHYLELEEIARRHQMEPMEMVLRHLQEIEDMAAAKTADLTH